MVLSLSESWPGSGELLGAGAAGDGHACLPRAFAVRAIHDDPVVSSDGGLLAQRARRHDACVEILVQQARTPIMSSTHGHAFLEVVLCFGFRVGCRDGVEHSVVIRITSVEDLQLVSTRPALHRLLMIDKACEVWTSGFRSHAQLASISGVLTRPAALP